MKGQKKHIFKDIRKIVVIKLRHIGDVLLTAPVFKALKENFPDAKIAALVNSGTEEALSGHPDIDEVIVFDRTIKKFTAIQRYIKEISFLRGVRAKGFDMAVDLTSGDRAAIISLLSGARCRLSYDPAGAGFTGKRFLYTHLAKRNGCNHMVLQNLDVIREFGISTKDLAVDIFIPPEDDAYVEKILRERGAAKSDILVHIHPTSRWLFKSWKDEYMAGTIDYLLKKGAYVAVTSSPDRREIERAKNIL
ncbi:MAG: putative lipopolysaccharide heptosyltransferase III, partial [Nitrospirae bacterium]|nr:putative lipopolysaccharide heptosyltransferase III [Nitrospirota bacterium]